MQDFLSFNKMITPVFIKIIFWIGLGLNVIAGLITAIMGIAQGQGEGCAMAFLGLVWIILGPVFWRIYCELLIVVFTINDTLTEIKNASKKQD